jgi:hypothetical protein
VELLSDERDVNVAGVAGRFDRVVERNADGYRDQHRHEVDGERRDDRAHGRGAAVGDRGGDGEGKGAEEGACHEQRVDDRAVDVLEGADEGAVVRVVQAGHDRVRRTRRWRRPGSS